MIHEIAATDLGNKSNKYLNNIEYGRNTYVIKQGKKEISAIINIELFNRLKRLEHNFRDINSRIAQIGESMRDLEVDKLAAAAVKVARKQK